MAQGLFDTSGDNQQQFQTQPQQAVAPAPSPVTSVAQSGALQTFGGLAEGLMQGFAAGKKQAIQSNEDRDLTTYARKVTALNAAVEQGTLKKAEAQRQQRALYNSIIANNPAVTDKLTSFNSTLAGSSGLGDTLSKGTAVDQQLETDTKAATAAGFIQPNMSPDAQQAGLNAFRQQQHAINQMDFHSKQLGIIQQKMSIAASQESIAASRVQRANAAVDLQLKRNKQRTQQALGDVATSYFDKTQIQMQQLQQDIASGKVTQEQGMQQLMQMKTDFNALTMQVRGTAGADFVDGLAKPINDSIDTMSQMVSGKLSNELGQAKLDKANIIAQSAIMSNPKMAAIMTVSKAMGAAFNPQLLANVGPSVIKFIDNTLKGNPPDNHTPADPEAAADTKTYLGLLRDATKNLGNNDPRIDDHPATFAEVKEHANQVLHSVADFQSAQKQPAQLNNVMDYFASPEFLALQKMGGKSFDEDALTGAENAITINYNNKLIPAVREEWQNALTTIGAPTGVKTIGRVEIPIENQTATPKAIQYVWTGTSIQFKPAAGYENNPTVLAKARELQKSLAPLINKNVRVAAHLQGSDNYTKYFKENEANFFGEPGTPAGNSNGE